MYNLKLIYYCLHQKIDWGIHYYTQLPSTSLAPSFTDSCSLLTGDTGNKYNKELRSCTTWN